MPFQFQVYVRKGTGHEWSSVRPTGGKPYEYATRDEAHRNMAMCYPDEILGETVRVIEVKADNPNCDGDHCASSAGEVRVYPLGGGGNLILCHACFAHENRYRYGRGRETGEPSNWPQVNWHTAKVYESA